MSKPFLRERSYDDSAFKPVSREGIPIEKGAVLNEDYCIQHEELFRQYANFFIQYPDLFIDLITPTESGFHLYFYQRLTLRVLMRYKYVFVTAPRAFSKSFLSIMAEMLQSIFIPNTKRFICAPGKGQSIKIATEKTHEIFNLFPFLKREVKGWQAKDIPGNYSAQDMKLSFENGSIFDVVGALDSTRGGRRHGGLIDEVRDHDEKLLNEVVLPLLNVSRRMPNGEVNPQEINQQQLYMTSAGVKTSFAYQKLIDIFITSIIAPDTTFCFGCDYRIPLLHGLIDKAFVMNQKASASYSDEAFSREYLSSWTGSDDESWLDHERLVRYRKLKNPEKHYINRAGIKQFYLLSVDVGRFHDQTVVMIFRVTQKAEKYYAALVNIKVLGLTPERKRMQQQAIDIKKLIFDYSPREVVIDTNGVGAGLADEMIVSQIEDGIIYPAYGFFNDENYKKIQPKDAPQILFSMKATATLKPQLHSNVFNRINAGRVRFLIKEQEAKSLLLETKVGRRMDPAQRAKRLMPHELTTKLFEEMLNLRLKRTGTSLDINLEQINTRYPDDKYMAFAYGLWRIKELEEAEIKKQKRRSAINISELVFYTGR